MDLVVGNCCDSECPGCASFARGGANCDGLVNNFDIDPFVMLLAGE
ncbi:MAG: hypothetical protein JNG88_04770 [Phycisphaerales bacterium]|nr:hypothetical protein [Phycisphaerales bacterium]